MQDNQLDAKMVKQRYVVNETNESIRVNDVVGN